MPSSAKDKITMKSKQPISKEQNEIIDGVREYLMPRIKRSLYNANRAIKLASLYNSLKDKTELSSDPVIDDILRASVVFSHATLEDFLRTIAAKFLPYASEAVLDQIPLSGLDSSSRAEKFYLGKLLKHREKTVEEVIEESINDFLKSSNYNDVKDISRLLENINFDMKKVQHLFPAINELMQRRHLIVHRADIDEHVDSNGTALRNININDVGRWLNAVVDLIGIITIEIGEKEFVPILTKN
jgi:hypothetical protein